MILILPLVLVLGVNVADVMAELSAKGGREAGRHPIGAASAAETMQGGWGGGPGGGAGEAGVGRAWKAGGPGVLEN